MTSVTLCQATAHAWRMSVGVTAPPVSPTTGTCWVREAASAVTVTL